MEICLPLYRQFSAVSLYAREILKLEGNLFAVKIIVKTIAKAGFQTCLGKSPAPLHILPEFGESEVSEITITAACEIENTNFHAIRHTFSARHIELGFDVKSLCMILGHASVMITMNRYVSFHGAETGKHEPLFKSVYRQINGQ